MQVSLIYNSTDLFSVIFTLLSNIS